MLKKLSQQYSLWITKALMLTVLEKYLSIIINPILYSKEVKSKQYSEDLYFKTSFILYGL